MSQLLAQVKAEFIARVVAPDAGGRTVLASTLGLTAAARGGAQASLGCVYRNPGGTMATPG
ncbi:hypothetical protein H9Y04_24710 [Streptomyces sp. TRM66268-LWL]|uniref:Uncharacterized protein n=1 Tax=Streptomyces polyasparticus TaxID=2767826 RepID=A0ABR7SLM9_9ACTN|nr:hypothetical protein [Streptomyces polyasparticus]MBC9715749.1 hypothetical protein [Streptomyces polyasparticus]